jgi:hypothetical protein
VTRQFTHRHTPFDGLSRQLHALRMKKPNEAILSGYYPSNQSLKALSDGPIPALEVVPLLRLSDPPAGRRILSGCRVTMKYYHET